MAGNTARRILLSLAGLLACAVSLSAWANRVVRVYEVDLKGPQSAASLQAAMREALVRATGRRESANDPAFAALVQEASSYVKGYTPGPRGGTQVVFDRAAVERAVAGVGRSVWDSERPFTLIVLYPPPARAAEDSARAELEQVAIERGLPVTLVPLSPVDASGNELGGDALLQMAQKYGGDAVLVGRGDLGSANGQWQWTLHSGLSSESWSGPLSAGVNGAVDDMASPQGGSLAQTEANARVEVDGVSGLADFANVERLLESIPGVRRTSVIAADGSRVVFDVLVRGGSEAVGRALSGTPHMVKTEASSARLAYQYRH